ncbi:MAG: hypothetical protein AAF513_01505 [Pseudomonadota bacterium]
MHAKKALAIKFMIITGLCALAAVFSIDAHAGGRHYSGYGHHYGYHDYGYRSYRQRHYRHRNYGHRHYYRDRHHSRRAAYLAGGLILGGLLTHSYHRAHEPVVVRESRVIRSGGGRYDTRVSRRLFRDRDGNCFERTTNRNGEELLAELDRAECAW